MPRILALKERMGYPPDFWPFSEVRQTKDKYGSEGNQSFANGKLFFGMLILSCLLKNKTQREPLTLPFTAQEIQTEKNASGKKF